MTCNLTGPIHDLVLTRTLPLIPIATLRRRVVHRHVLTQVHHLDQILVAHAQEKETSSDASPDAVVQVQMFHGREGLNSYLTSLRCCISHVLAMVS